MSSVTNDTTIDKAIADEQVDGTPTGEPDNALSATESEQAIKDEIKKDKDEVVELAVATLDPKDMLKKHVRLGNRALKHAEKRKASLAKGAWNGEKDLKKVCDDLEETVRMRVPIKDIRMLLYIRMALWVEAVKALVPNVEKLSYHQVANKFVPTLSFDPVELTGEIKKEWLTWVRVTVERQLSDDPLPMKELDKAIEERKEEIERERLARSKRTPEEVLEAERKAEATKKRKAREAAQSKVSNAIADALNEGNADVNDIVQVMRQAAATQDESVRKGLVVIDAEYVTVEECKCLASVLCAAGKLTEMKYLRDRLDAMIKIAENAMVTSQSA